MASFIPVDSDRNRRFFYDPEFLTVALERNVVYTITVPADGVALYFFFPDKKQSVIVLPYAVRLRNIIVLFEQTSRYIPALVTGCPVFIFLQLEYICVAAGNIIFPPIWQHATEAG